MKPAEGGGSFTFRPDKNKGSMTASEPRLPDDFSDVEEIPRNSGRIRVALEIAVALLVLVGIYFLFAPQTEIELPPLQPQEIDPIIRAQIDAAQQPTAENPTVSDTDSPRTSGTPSVEEAATVPDEPALSDGATARRLIADLRSGKQSLGPAEMVQQADSYQQAGHLTDAYLLLFYAARQGDGEAAFALASLHDPNHFVPGSSLLESPDSLQAYKWYSQAAAQKIPQAQQRLQDLHSTLEKQATAGDPAARRLLLNWQ